MTCCANSVMVPLAVRMMYSLEAGQQQRLWKHEHRRTLCPADGQWEEHPGDLGEGWFCLRIWAKPTGWGSFRALGKKHLVRTLQQVVQVRGWRFFAKSSVWHKDEIASMRRGWFTTWLSLLFYMSSFQSVCFALEGWDCQNWGDHQLSGIKIYV